MNDRRWVAALAAALPVAYAAARVAVAARARAFETFDPDTEELPGVLLSVRGRRLHVVMSGEGPPLLLIHGFGAAAFAFGRVAPLLDRHARLIAVDLPGHGYSERSPATDYTYEALADLLVDLLDRLDIGRADVLGHSIGAAIAMRIAARRPERVRGLVLAGGPGGLDPAFPAALRPAIELVAPLLAGSRGATRWFTKSAMTRGAHVDEDLVDAYYAASRVRGHAASLVAMLAGTRHGPAPDPATIQAPALVLTGERDNYMPPRRARALAERLPHARLALIPDAAHLLLDEQPDRCAAEILAFLRELPTATLTPPEERPPGEDGAPRTFRPRPAHAGTPDGTAPAGDGAG